MPGVQLKTVRYFEWAGKPKEWTLDGLSLGPVNLMVGKNATGKTRSLNVIWNLAKHFLPESKFRTGNAGYDVLFDNNGQELRYELTIEEAKVTREVVTVGEDKRLERVAGARSQIWAVEEGRMLRFRPPENELAAVARRDSLQHGFLEPLHEWAMGVRHYTFGASLGKNFVAVPAKEGPETDERDANQVFGIFHKAKEKLGKPFVDAVIRDMAEMHYDLEEIEPHAPEGMRLLKDGIPTAFMVLGVKERGINAVVDQAGMSQGMFRALSILIQVNYSEMANRANCILIDDIGEGLDFERSTRLIEILRRKARHSSFQLVMTTNDQFVMNHVPLEEWSVLQRTGSRVTVRNHENSKEAFEQFKFIGMSNFTFFEMDFVNSPPAEVGAVHE